MAGSITRLCLSAVLLFAGADLQAIPISIDFAQLPNGASTRPLQTITNEYGVFGIDFYGLGNRVFVGSVFDESGSRSYTGLTHAIESPFPGQKNGIRGVFREPVRALAFDVHTNSLRDEVMVSVLQINGVFESRTLPSAAFFRGTYSGVFALPISEFQVLSSKPNESTVGIRNVHFPTVPEPSSLALILSGLWVTPLAKRWLNLPHQTGRHKARG